MDYHAASKLKIGDVVKCKNTGLDVIVETIAISDVDPAFKYYGKAVIITGSREKGESLETYSLWHHREINVK